MRGADHSYPGVQLAAWNVTKEKLHQRHFHAAYLKTSINVYTTSILPVGQLRLAAR